MITPYVTIAGRKEFERNKTGFGYMVMDIAKAVGKMEYVDVLATDTRGNGFENEGVKFIKRSMISYLWGIFNCLSIGTLLNLRKCYLMSNGSFIRLMYYWFMTGYLKCVIKNGEYDIVHIHGCDFYTELWMKVCRQCGQKYIVTLHGLNSFSDTVKLEPAGKQFERDFLKRVAEGEFPITVISTGMKRLIEKTYGVCDSKNITVVCNSFTFSETSEGDEFLIRNLYGLPKESRIIVCVGNIGIRKNQGQLITAFYLLPKELASRTYILFLGGNQSEDYTIERFSANSPWASHFIACGLVPKEQVEYYYAQCDAVALMSLSEGFGLSLIEGMHFGKPCMSFTDVDAYEDIYHPDVMIGVEEHSDTAVAKGMVKLLTGSWDKEIIKLYSKKFESQNMAKEYIKAYCDE